MGTDSRFTDAAREAAALAAVVCRNVQRNLAAVRTITKDDRSPVTVADLASQALVCAVLSDRLGKDFLELAFVAEEDASFLRKPENAAYREAALQAIQQVRSDISEETMLGLIDRGGGQDTRGRFWTLDPIDGTKGFLRGEQYAIALAFIEDGTPSLGVLACPNLPRNFDAPVDRADEAGSLYVAVRGSGVEEHACFPIGAPAPRRVEPLAPKPQDRPLRACASVEKAHNNVSDTDRVLTHLGASLDIIRMDSSAKYAVVARGQADAYLRLPTRKDYVERIWDHAAGTVLATETGCIVSDIHGRRLDFGHGRGLERNKGVIVAERQAHPRIISAIAELGIGS